MIQCSLECSYIPIPSRMFSFYATGETLCPQGVSVTLFGVLPFQFPFPVSCFLYCRFAVLTLLSHLLLSYTWACLFILISFILNLWLVSRTGWSFPSFFVFTVVCGCVLWRHCCYATGSQSCLNYIGKGLIWPSQAFHASVHHFVCSERWRLIRWHLYL